MTLITWSQVVTWRIENLISPLLQDLHHQIQHGGDVWSYETTHRVTWFFDYAVLWGHMKNLKSSFFSSAKPIAPKLGRWRGSTLKAKWLLNQVVTWQIKNSKLKIALLAIKETFNRNILIWNIYFFNQIVLIRNFFFKSTISLKLENTRSFRVQNCTKSDFAKYVWSGVTMVNNNTSILFLNVYKS